MSSTASRSLVSIVIPCYNSQDWVQETIESCLRQTYPNIEIIAIDDGSTDGSLEILRRFLPHIRLETGPNRGGNHARNRGFSLSKGEYIQYLDADDYLEPDKIARQVQFLEETKADVVYGDWRHRIHLPNRNVSYLGKVQVSGAQQDVLATLLSNLWINGGAILYRREVIDQVGGWDETLRAAQDRDLFASAALSGADIRYQPGCSFIYRQYGAVTVSSSSRSRWLENHCLSLRKSEAALANAGRLTDKYKAALANGYFDVARAPFTWDAQASFVDYKKTLNGFIDKILSLCPDFKPIDETPTFLALHSLIGLRPTIHLLFSTRSAADFLKSRLKNTFLLELVLRIRGVELDRS